MTDDPGATPDAEADYPDSGPYCRHWSTLGDCDDECASCKHSCGEHRDDGGCWECDCPGWKDAE